MVLLCTVCRELQIIVNSEPSRSSVFPFLLAELSKDFYEGGTSPMLDVTCQTVFQAFSSIIKVRVLNFHSSGEVPNPHVLSKVQPLTLASSTQQLPITYQNSLFQEKANEQVGKAFQSVSEQSKIRGQLKNSKWVGIRRCLTQTSLIYIRLDELTVPCRMAPGFEWIYLCHGDMQ